MTANIASPIRPLADSERPGSKVACEESGGATGRRRAGGFP
jgi:hypothetical protein